MSGASSDMEGQGCNQATELSPGLDFFLQQFFVAEYVTGLKWLELQYMCDRIPEAAHRVRNFVVVAGGLIKETHQARRSFDSQAGARHCQGLGTAVPEVRRIYYSWPRMRGFAEVDRGRMVPLLQS